MTTQTYTQIPTTGHKTLSLLRLFLHLESFMLFIGSVALYAHLSGDWIAYAVLFLVPDISAIAYAMNQRVGSMAYNIMHSYSLPVVLALIALSANWMTGVVLALIWTSHIAIDRALGMGLKYVDRPFKETHFNVL